ncbi:limonene-1,2-epoxide hydrolase family protein [Segniliparus rugosus]|uniref:Limonene-1,2-epoxide hydrolase domain-containing protein n=1 Tax=Segniliparus rugosus (strain ATCC BAA-974 / DSM 45345 / CCUG 50838 / CIP 108380 / JCM 13579 / CDC 945) TaxID=679197 RepID=E5XTU3_SEGRC|nr:limonene-1,2-epoxide hydrolase family protein [Segniliparus rugosus]EFV12223.1 hypothetical protein HMPREF9336_02915 [Segniliparus rugosus ATCC BAA-974]
MTLSSVPTESRAEPKDVVLDLLQALHDFDQAAVDLLDDQIEYVNVSASKVRGALAKRGVSAFLAFGARRRWLGFDIALINVAQDGDVVLTERLDALRIGPFVAQFWVIGRFEVKNGRITVWRDYFDYLNGFVGLLRGVLGVAVPALRPKQTHQIPQLSH